MMLTDACCAVFHGMYLTQVHLPSQSLITGGEYTTVHAGGVVGRPVVFFLVLPNLRRERRVRASDSALAMVSALSG